MRPPDILQLTGSLSELQDIIMPEAVGFFPPAPGLYPIGLILIAIAVNFFINQYRNYKQNRYRRQAMDQLKGLEKIIISSSDETLRINAASSLPVLLKRTAITAFGREKTAALSQNSWMNFLNSKISRTRFSSDMAGILSICAWGSKDQILAISRDTFKELLSLMGAWITTHERPAERLP